MKHHKSWLRRQRNPARPIFYIDNNVYTVSKEGKLETHPAVQQPLGWVMETAAFSARVTETPSTEAGVLAELAGSYFVCTNSARQVFQ